MANKSFLLQPMRDGSPYNKRKLSLEWWGRVYRVDAHATNNMSFKWPNKRENRSFVRLKFFLHGVLRFEQWTDLLAKLDIMTPSTANSLRSIQTNIKTWILDNQWIFQASQITLKNQFRHREKLTNRLEIKQTDRVTYCAIYHDRKNLTSSIFH